MARWLWSPAVVLALLLHLHVARAGFEHTCDLDARGEGAHPQGMCGARLSNVLSDLCGPSGYAGMAPFRKRAIGMNSETGERLRNLLLNRRQALSYLQKESSPVTAVGYYRRLQKRHGSRGITCECCLNPCSLGELLQYCN